MKMKTLLFLILTLISQFLVAQCIPSAIVFSNQAQVDAFPNDYPGCTTILGNVGITNGLNGLDSLYQIKKINGSLSILNSGIYDLDGLNNLDSIKGSLTISNNTVLGTIDSISSVVVNNSITISNNNSLSAIPSFPNISKLNGNLYLYNNSLLSIGSSPIFINLDSVASLDVIFDNLNQNSFGNLKKANSIQFNGTNSTPFLII